MIFVTLKSYTYSVPTERLSCWFIISTNLSFLRNLFYLGKFSTHIAFQRNAFLGGHYFYKPDPMELIYLGKFSTHRAFLLNAFLGTLFSTNLSFLRNFILFGKIFYTYSVPTELYFIWENFVHI